MSTPERRVVIEGGGNATARVTVGVSLFNYRRFIVDCLESVAIQTFTPVDLLVVDDASTDGGDELVHEWLARHGTAFNRYALVRHAGNEGLSSARNTAFSMAETEYVFVLDADNAIYPRCLQQLASALDNCAAAFAYCYLEQFDDVCGLLNVAAWNPDTFRDGNRIDAMVLLRRDVWSAVGGYSVDMACGWEDFDLWFKIARAGGWGVQVPETLGRYRVHGDSMLATVTNPNAERLWRQLRTKFPEFFTS